MRVCVCVCGIHTFGTDWSCVAVQATMTNKSMSAVTSFINLVTVVAQRQFQHRCTQTRSTHVVGPPTTCLTLTVTNSRVQRENCQKLTLGQRRQREWLKLESQG